MPSRVRELQPPELVERRIELALRMLELGAWVFPLAHGSKMPLIPKAKGGHGFLDASPDPDRARTFLSNPGQPNYGVVFPEGSDVIALDLDGGSEDRPGWREDWQRLYELHGPPGLSFIVKTPSDGRHAYYRWRVDLYGPIPPGDEMLGWTVRKPWKGYLVGPGSVVDGTPYELVGVEHILDLPEPWVTAALGEHRAAPARASDDIITLTGPAQVQAGHRHKYLRDQARYLRGLGLSVAAIEAAVLDINAQLPEPKSHEDVRKAIGDVERFSPDAVDEESGTRVSNASGDDAPMLSRATVGDFPYPPDPAAFDGLLGECVLTLADGTDASLVGLLGSLVAFCGALVPGRAYFHRLQTTSPFLALVGESSIGRKGTAMMRVHDAIADALEAVYVNRVILDGLNSGEGLIASLAWKRQAFPYEPTVGLVLEEEFASLLASRSRDGSTLDSKLRIAFDGGPLANRKVSGSTTLTPPYWLPALIAITPTEIRTRLEAGALQSGSANRWLYLPVVRRDITPSNAEPRFTHEQREALQAARRVALDAKAAPLAVDHAVVDTLSAYADFLPGVSSGVAHDLSRRYSVIAFRIALVHATAERSARITTAYLERALALVEYARSGIGWVFGGTVSDPHADLLLRHLQAAGSLQQRLVSRLIRDPIKRQGAIDELLRLGYARVEATTPTTRGGRPRTDLVLEPGKGRFVPFVPGPRTTGRPGPRNSGINPFHARRPRTKPGRNPVRTPRRPCPSPSSTTRRARSRRASTPSGPPTVPAPSRRTRYTPSTTTEERMGSGSAAPAAKHEERDRPHDRRHCTVPDRQAQARHHPRPLAPLHVPEHDVSRCDEHPAGARQERRPHGLGQPQYGRGRPGTARPPRRPARHGGTRGRHQGAHGTVGVEA